MANIALYPGGYKPPHIGHYKAAKIATEQTDKVIVFVGPKEREGITNTFSWSRDTPRAPAHRQQAASGMNENGGGKRLSAAPANTECTAAGGSTRRGCATR